MRSWIRISHFHPPSFTLPLPLSSSLRCKISSSTASSQKDWPRLYKECDEFLPWLRQKTGCEISSVLSVGFSSHGRSLFASKPIQAGDCILKVPYSAQLMTNTIQSEIDSLLVDVADNISRLALILLAEKKLGQDSEWAPYINSLPHICEMHNTMFWSEEELNMVRASSIYQEIIDQKAHLEKEFLALKPVLDRWHQNIGDIKAEDFMHACALIISRAWRTSKGISLIPFADFLNHDGISEAVLLSDDIKETSEVVADRDYAVGEQVLIRYGKFPNATLMLDFGFTHPYNIHDQVQIWMDLPKHDPLCSSKLGIFTKHWFPSSPEANDLNSSGRSFLIREVKSPKAKGKGIPQALRAYTRILSITSHEELEALVIEAAENDGRLARRPLRNIESEIQAHSILLSQFTHLIQERDAAVKVLEAMSSPDAISRVAIRKKMAIDLLNGEATEQGSSVIPLPDTHLPSDLLQSCGDSLPLAASKTIAITILSAAVLLLKC